MLKIVELYPFIDVGLLKRFLFAGQGSTKSYFEVKVGFTLVRFGYQPGALALHADYRDDDEAVQSVLIDLRFTQLKHGLRTYFVCPKTGKPCSHLYLVDGVFASRIGHGLSHASRVGRSNDKVRAHTGRIAKRLSGVAGKGPARGDRRRRLLEALQPYQNLPGLDQAAQPYLDQLAQERAQATWERTYGLQSMAPPNPMPLDYGWYYELSPSKTMANEGQACSGGYVDSKMLKAVTAARARSWRPVEEFTASGSWDWESSAGTVRSLRPDPTFFAGQVGALELLAYLVAPKAMGGCDQVLMAFFPVLSDKAWLLIHSYWRGRRNEQLIQAVKCRGLWWHFICPVSGEATSELYPRNGRWASLKAQKLRWSSPEPAPSMLPKPRRWDPAYRPSDGPAKFSRSPFPAPENPMDAVRLKALFA